MEQQDPPTAVDGERLITSATVRELFDDISAMSLWRWENQRGFPAPYCRIGGRKFWRFADVRDWIATQAEKKAA